MSANDDPMLTDLLPRQKSYSQGTRWKLTLMAVACVLAIALMVVARAESAEPLQLRCTPRAQEFDIEGKPTTITAYELFTGLAANALEPLAKVPVCNYDASSMAPGKWFFAWRQYNAIGPSQLGPVGSVTVAEPSKMLLTVGGDVWVASPNYAGPWPANGWKLGAKAGTIAPKIKCDATRQIGEDFFLVKGPVVWTAGKKNYVVARCAQS